MNKQISIGSKIQYTSAAGTRKAVVKNISIGPTAQPGFMNTWITLEIPIAKKLGAYTTVQIPGDNGSLKAFKVVVVD
jgi:hypothetical protein